MSSIDSTMLCIDKMPQYFFDNVLIEQIQDLTRVIHSPRKEPGPLLSKDRSWEHIAYLSCNTWNVTYDESNKEFKCWYEDWNFDPQVVAHPHSPPNQMRICYARSNNGLTWEKPELDYLEEGDHKTNVVYGNPSFGSVHAATVIDDPLESDPEKRFKMLFEHWSPEGERHVEVAHSRNGIEWTSFETWPRFSHAGAHLGDVFILNADVEVRLYRLTTRHPTQVLVACDERRPRTSSFIPPSFPHDPGRINKRRIFQSISSDLIRWSYPQCILAPDDQEDNLDDTYYGIDH